MAERTGLSQQERTLFELLPWYVNDTLTGPERGAVERLVNSNLLARKEYERLKEVQQACADKDPTPDASDKWPELLDRVDAYEAGVTGRIGEAFSRWWRRADWRMGRLGSVIITAQAAAIACLAVVLMWSQTRDAEPRLARTLANPAAVGRDHYRIVLAPDMSERRVRQLLLELEAQFVAGPSPTGVYTIAVQSPEHAAAAIGRFGKEVRFFEPAGDD